MISTPAEDSPPNDTESHRVQDADAPSAPPLIEFSEDPPSHPPAGEAAQEEEAAAGESALRVMQDEADEARAEATPACPAAAGSEPSREAGRAGETAQDGPDPPIRTEPEEINESDLEEYDPTEPTLVEQVRAFLILFALTAFVAWLASRWTGAGMDGWYESLHKPDWTPPGWVFRSVWAAIYLKVTVAAWLVWRRAGLEDSAEALSLWVLQLCLNAAWPGLFFGMRSPALAAVEIPLLWLAVAATAREMRRIHPGAALLMAPYLVWVAFLGLLNYLIWWMNSPM